MKKVIALILAVGLLLTGCGVNTASRDLMKGVKPSDQRSSLITMDEYEQGPFAEPAWENALIADFGMRLFQASFEADKNTLISPMSVLAALAMTANGAEGQTLAQMETVLGQRRDALNSWYQYGTRYDDEFLHQANGIWFKENSGLTVNQDFLQTNADYYGAGIYQAPFNDSTVKDINNFVEENTKGMVPEVLTEIPEESVIYLVNALALDAKWKETYQGGQVHPATFTKEDGTKQDAELMWSEESLYYENDFCTGFQKPYVSQGRLAFVAGLPKEGVTMEELLAGLEEMGLQHFLASCRRETVEVALPKFEAHSDVQMGEVLMDMGMTDAFDASLADFSGMAASDQGNIYLSRVIHKTFISVAEKGTKAGATTVVAAAEEAAMEEMKRVVLNRPFLYMIVDTSSNTPIFMGTLMEIQ